MINFQINLYKGKITHSETTINTELIAEILKEVNLKSAELNSKKGIDKPFSTARDAMGFSQQEIYEIIKK